MFFVMCNDTFPSFLQKLAGGGARREAVEGWSATCRAEASQISPSSADGPSLESHWNPKGPAEMPRGKKRPLLQESDESCSNGLSCVYHSGSELALDLLDGVCLDHIADLDVVVALDVKTAVHS